MPPDRRDPEAGGARDPFALLPGPALEQLGPIRLADNSMTSVLDAVVTLVQQSLPGDAEAAVPLLRGGTAVTAEYSGDLARTLDEAQDERGDGPCLVAATGGRPVEVPGR